MSKSSRLALILIVALTACAKPVVVPDNNDFLKEGIPFKKTLGLTVNSPAKNDVLVENPLILLDQEDATNGSVNARYVLIDGLKNTAVEAKINADILAMVDKLSAYKSRESFPSYHGFLRRIVSDNKEARETQVYTNVTFNANNVLSILIQGDYYFGQAGNDIIVGLSEGMTFDLNTGERLSISDVVTNDTDPTKVLGPWIQRELFSNTYDSDNAVPKNESRLLDQIGAFKGVPGNQNFTIGINSVDLYLDYRNPEFDTHLQAYPIQILFGDIRPYLAITRRFASEKSLFENPPVTKKLTNFVSIDNVRTQEVKNENGIAISISTTYPQFADAIPQSILDLIQPMTTDIDVLITSAKASLGDVKRVNIDLWIARNGRFTQIGVTKIAYQLKEWINEKDGETYPYDIGPQEYMQTLLVFDEAEHQVKLADMFAKDYDYQGILKTYIAKNVARNESPSAFYGKEEELLANLQFSLNQAYFFFNTWIAEPNGTRRNLTFYFDYSEIGIDNLTIFN